MTPEPTEQDPSSAPAASSDFIRDDRRGRPRSRQARRARRHALPARAERLSPHRPRQVDLPELRHRRGVRRHLQPPLRRHQPRRRKTSSTSTSIQEDVRWLGFDWDDRLFYASDYFEQLYECAVELIRKGKAYVDSLTRDEIRAAPRHADRAGREQPVPRPHRSRRTSTSSRACGRASSRTARTCCAPRSTWRRPT